MLLYRIAKKVRSVILPPQYEKDFNIILNPEHPDFCKLTTKTVVECPFDIGFTSNPING